MKRARKKSERVVYWIQSSGFGGRHLVPMVVKGRLRRDTDEGRRGDVQARPVALGPGEYTATYAADDFVDAEGRPAFR